jgi:hypothetical protein
MTGTGSTTLTSTGTLSLGGDGSYQILDTRTFTNQGHATWLGTSGYFYLSDGAVFNNAGTFTVNCDESVLGSSGAAFNNTGTFTKSSSSGTTEFSSTLFNNSGTVNLQSGTLRLDNGGSDGSAGAFVVAAGAVLDFNGGNTLLASSIGTSATAQPGEVMVSAGNVDVIGSYNISGNTTVSGGMVNFYGGLVSLGPTVTISSGTADVFPNITIPTLDLTGGTLTGPGAITITGMLTWNNYGQMTGTGSTTLTSTGTLSLGGDGSYQILDTRTFTNKGHATWLVQRQAKELGCY